MLNSLLNAFGSPAVTLAYYLFTFFAIEAALVIAWGQWQRSDSFRARRLTVAFGSMTLLRVVLFVLAFMSRSSVEVANLWLPPFERAMGVASLGFLVWGFTPFMREKGLSATVLLAIGGPVERRRGLAPHVEVGEASRDRLSDPAFAQIPRCRAVDRGGLRRAALRYFGETHPPE